jgi:hypothetical protein
MIDAGQANAAQNHAGGAPLVGGATGQGIIAGAANAVSIGSKPVRGIPHGIPTALAGIIEGAKKSIAAINMVLTILRKLMIAPTTHFPAITILPSEMSSALNGAPHELCRQCNLWVKPPPKTNFARLLRIYHKSGRVGWRPRFQAHIWDATDRTLNRAYYEVEPIAISSPSCSSKTT